MNAEDGCCRHLSAGIEENAKNTVDKRILVLQKDEKSNIMSNDECTTQGCNLTHKKESN